jgi:hypothetical protein
MKSLFGFSTITKANGRRMDSCYLRDFKFNCSCNARVQPSGLHRTVKHSKKININFFATHFRYVIIVVAFLGQVYADPKDNTYALEKTTLCADETSVQLYADDSIFLDLEDIHHQLVKQLNNVLTNSSIPVTFQDSCQGLSAYTLLSIYLYYLDPNIYKEYQEGAFSYVMYVQVGGYLSKVDMTSQYTLPNSQFLSFFEGIYVSIEGQTRQDQLEDQSVSMLLELAKAWWDDNPPPRSYLPHLYGTILALGTASAIYMGFKRRFTQLSNHRKTL